MATTRSTLNPVGMAAAIYAAKTEEQPERLLTAQDVAQWLGVSARWVLAHAAGLNRPVMPSVKLGKAVACSDLEDFIRQCARHYRAG